MTAPVIVDVEQLIRAWLQNRFPDAFICTELPPAFEQYPRVAQVTRAGGQRRFTTEQPRIVVDSFATATADGIPARPAARAWALEICAAFQWDLRGAQLADGVHVAATGDIVANAPVFVPDGNTTTRHYAGTYAPRITAALHR